MLSLFLPSSVILASCTSHPPLNYPLMNLVYLATQLVSQHELYQCRIPLHLVLPAMCMTLVSNLLSLHLQIAVLLCPQLLLTSSGELTKLSATVCSCCFLGKFLMSLVLALLTRSWPATRSHDACFAYRILWDLQQDHMMPVLHIRWVFYVIAWLMRSWSAARSHTTPVLHIGWVSYVIAWLMRLWSIAI